MKFTVIRAGRTVKIRLFVLVFTAALLSGTAYADILQDVNRLFELHAKLRPGMTIDALSAILGEPDESHDLRGSASITRFAWIHGRKGIVAYEVEGVAHRVAITLPCGSNQNKLRALDALTRRGHSIYGSMPMTDQIRNEFYWVRDGVRFAFSRYNQTTVLSSSTRAH